ncbi:MAG: hypothetical protein QM785_16280 [Pyrinomonadaceae bacterium]
MPEQEKLKAPATIAIPATNTPNDNLSVGSVPTFTTLLLCAATAPPNASELIAL